MTFQEKLDAGYLILVIILVGLALATLCGCSVGLGVQVGKAESDTQYARAKGDLPPIPADAPTFERGF